MTMNRDRLLRLTLTADAATCAVMGAGLALAAAALDDVLGIPTGWLVALGVALLGVAAGIGWVATRPTIEANAGWLVIAGNLVWVAASVVAVVAGFWPLTVAGTVLVIGQAVAVLALVDLEYLGLRRVAA
jgi:hypothetical protein